jgi:hypothetical protein
MPHLQARKDKTDYNPSAFIARSATGRNDGRDHGRIER